MTFNLGPALLFCPADRPERYGKAADRADAVILDLEDAVAPADRPRARAAMIEHPLDPGTTMVRVNEAGSADHAEDLAALAKTSYRMIMLPKASSSDQVDALEGFEVVALCESAAGILAARHRRFVNRQFC